MCFGGAPSAPTVQYIGPSQADIDANEAALAAYAQETTESMNTLSNQLQGQIDAASAETEALQTQFAGDLAAAEAQGAADVDDAKEAGAAAVAGAGQKAAAQQVGALTVTAMESEPVDAQTTTAVTEKKKPKKNLKITPGATASNAGAGLNIGV